MQLKLNLKPIDTETPSPIYINDDFSVDWADYEGADPITLLGFVWYFSTIRKEVLDLDYQTFYAFPALATDKYIVFTNTAGEWISDKQYNVESVEIIEDVEP